MGVAVGVVMGVTSIPHLVGSAPMPLVLLVLPALVVVFVVVAAMTVGVPSW